MNIALASLAVFLGGYLLNIFYISVLYHRGLTHSAVELSPAVRKWTVLTGSWITGIDPKAWACMHRLHHRHSDTALDPHSPQHLGVFGVMRGQLRSYEKALSGLARGRRGNDAYASVVKDLDFPVNWLNRQRVWWLPYLLHAVLAVALAFAFHSWLLGAAYWFGIMSHPIQGWMVNSFAHRFGYQNHANGDQSRNNTLVAWLVMGEGYQNNHHARPGSAQFAERWFEFDGGYWLCVLAERIGWLRIRERAVGAPAVTLKLPPETSTPRPGFVSAPVASRSRDSLALSPLSKPLG
jgi:stearoyl-CoA desaturase (delta-9 desaturase)